VELIKLTCENQPGYCSFFSTLKNCFHSLSEQPSKKEIQVTDTEQKNGPLKMNLCIAIILENYHVRQRNIPYITLEIGK